jgi:hypothetical protein
MYGSTFMEYRYIDPRKEDDSYIWVAMFRRIRRLSTAQRGDTIDGADASYCDGEGYSGQVNRNTYKLLEVKDMLACRHQDENKLHKQKGQGQFNGQQRERCKLYQVEVLNKDPDHIYTKEIWYLDGETWQMPYKQTWDRQGRLWRFMDSFIGYKTSVKGYPVADVVGYNFADMQRYHADPNVFKDIKHGEEYSLEIFTLQYIQKAGR